MHLFSSRITSNKPIPLDNIPWTKWSVVHLAFTNMHYQFSSVAQSCLTLCNPMDCSTPGFPVLHCLPELAQTHVHRIGDAIQPFHPLSSPFSSCLQSFPASGTFLMSQPFASDDQNIGASASASVLPMNVQG